MEESCDDCALRQVNFPEAAQRASFGLWILKLDQASFLGRVGLHLAHLYLCKTCIQRSILLSKECHFFWLDFDLLVTMVLNSFRPFSTAGLILLFCAAQVLGFSGRVTQLVPDTGAWLGFSSGDGTPQPYNHTGYIAILGIEPAVHLMYVSLPLRDYEQTQLKTLYLKSYSKSHVMLLLTVQPFAGLSAVTDQACLDLASMIRKFEAVNSVVIIRFAHEMNGNWYPWGQQPLEYVGTTGLL